jgi:hypothetical protein
MNNFQIDNGFQKKMMCDIKRYFKGNENFTINGLHGVLAFYRFYILGCFG